VMAEVMAKNIPAILVVIIFAAQSILL